MLQGCTTRLCLQIMKFQFNYLVCSDCGWVVLAPTWTSRWRKLRGFLQITGLALSRWIRWYLRERKQGDFGREKAQNGRQGREGREPWCLGAQHCRQHGNHRKKATEDGTCHSGLQLWLGLAKEAEQGQLILSDRMTRHGTLGFREAAGAVTLPPVNSDPVRKHKCQASGNSVCHLGVHFPLDYNPSSLGEMCIPAFVVWFAKIPHGSLWFSSYMMLAGNFLL